MARAATKTASGNAVKSAPVRPTSLSAIGRRFLASLLLAFCLATRAQAQALYPDTTNDIAQQAWSELESNHWKAAEALFYEALASRPSNPDLVHGLAKSLYGEREFDQAATEFQLWLTLRPDATNAYYGMGTSYFALKRYADATTAFRKFVSLSPNNAVGYYGLFQSLNRQKNYRDAEAAIERAATISPKNFYYCLELSDSLENLDRNEEAIAALNRALLIIPTNSSARKLLGASYCQLGAYQDAVTALQQFVSREPTNAGGYYWLGHSLMGLHRFNEAADAYQKELQFNPQGFDGNLECGLALLLSGRYDESTIHFAKAHEIKKQDPAARNALFLLYLMSGQYQNAYETYASLCIGAGGLLLLCYFGGLVFLTNLSFKPGSNPFPGFWFSAGWICVFFEGQLACIGLLGILSLAKINETPLTAIILAGGPVIIIAIKGFARQPWGQPFAWPPRLGTANMKWLSLAALVLVFAFDAGYSALYERIAHHPMPGQEAIPLIKYSLRANPFTACLAIVVVAPMVEEILFRGLMFGALEKRLPISVVIVVSALLFALAHLQISYIVPIFCMGVVLGWIRWKSGSLGPSMLIHSLNNGLSLLFLNIF